MQKVEQETTTKMTSDIDYGFGVKYEKFILQKIIKEIVFHRRIRTVCEYPANNLMGNNSEIFDNLGCTTRRMKTLHATKIKHDLVWNFCEFENTNNPEKMIEDMLNLSSSYIFIVTQNNKNLGVRLHLLYHLLNGRKWNHGTIKSMSYGAVMKPLTKFSVEIVNYGWFDVPWFILDVYEMGQTINRVTHGKFVDNSDLKESRFEGLPNSIKSSLSHHFYVLAKKKPARQD